MAVTKEKELFINPATPAKAGRREWIGLAVLMLPTLLIVMDLTVLHLAVPHLSADLQPSSIQLLWIVDIYGFLIAGSLITMGTLGDRIGRRRLLPDLQSRNRTLRQAAERMAVNSVIQGTAADLIKKAMVEVDADLEARGSGARMILQESFYPTSTSRLVAERSGAPLVVIPAGPSFREGQSYFAWMNEVVRRLGAAPDAR